jgi:hypothetical protein
MSGKVARKKSLKGEQAAGVWLDTAVLSRLYGRKSPLATPTRDAETHRLLHYADVVLGTEKKEKFVSSKPTKDRMKL